MGKQNDTVIKKMREIAYYDYHSNLTVLQKAPRSLHGNFRNEHKDS